MSECSPIPFETEATQQGEQKLIHGVHPVSMKARLTVLAAHPLAPSKLQKPCNIGLFDDVARNQLDMFSTSPKPKDNLS
jgi:hypothetical protein